ncbi:hypothetical protein B0H17DRAFT_1232636 [Mycena rosella]|uniref:Uncharacterized protein n=1 Tax=Mycena rosella TaxID=1033263 RepID=A0AAD7GDS0_MYCRO|nr:hypothetical protein B0H17DRAFT_1232636 [Mycena rosella]
MRRRSADMPRSCWESVNQGVGELRQNKGPGADSRSEAHGVKSFALAWGCCASDHRLRRGIGPGRRQRVAATQRGLHIGARKAGETVAQEAMGSSGSDAPDTQWPTKKQREARRARRLTTTPKREATPNKHQDAWCDCMRRRREKRRREETRGAVAQRAARRAGVGKSGEDVGNVVGHSVGDEGTNGPARCFRGSREVLVRGWTRCGPWASGCWQEEKRRRHDGITGLMASGTGLIVIDAALIPPLRWISANVARPAPDLMQLIRFRIFIRSRLRRSTPRNPPYAPHTRWSLDLWFLTRNPVRLGLAPYTVGPTLFST